MAWAPLGEGDLAGLDSVDLIFVLEESTDMPGTISKEVVQALIENPLPVIPVKPVEVTPAPHSDPYRTVPEPGSEGTGFLKPMFVKAVDSVKTWSPTWWFEKGGIPGAMCGLCLLLFYALSGAQKEGQKALIEGFQTSEKNRSAENHELIRGILQQQAAMTQEMHQVAKLLEKLDIKLEKLSLPKQELH
jgi:hypothetical protein